MNGRIENSEIRVEEKERIYLEIRKEFFIQLQFKVADRYYEVKQSLDEENNLKDWCTSKSCNAAKYEYIFRKVIEESIEEGIITSAEDVKKYLKDIEDIVFEYIISNDTKREFQKLKSEMHNKYGNLPSITEENYRSQDGYGWLYNILQATLMWDRYKENGGPDLVENIDDWGSSSSIEFDKAIQFMIFIHQDKFLEGLDKDFYKIVTQIEVVMTNIKLIEEDVEKDLKLPHTVENRRHILEACDDQIVNHPHDVMNIHNRDIRDKFVKEVEEQLKVAA